jgi:transposase
MVYNRFKRWSGRGIWQEIFETVAGSPEPPEQAALDSTHVKAHRCAGGGKGGLTRVSPRAAATASFIPLSIN